MGLHKGPSIPTPYVTLSGLLNTISFSPTPELKPKLTLKLSNDSMTSMLAVACGSNLSSQ